MGALALSCATTGGLVYLFAGAGASQAASEALSSLPAPIATTAATAATTATTPTTASTPASSNPTASSATAETAATTATTATTAAPATTASTALVGYDGTMIQTRFGPVQVQAQVSGGQIVDVAVIQYPDGDGKSVRINSRALPTLRSEVLAAQSADVHTVSGATYTSNGYRQSLQSAIDEAKAAGALA
jgi:uncharacterized protein with FMN-binding domain